MTHGNLHLTQTAVNPFLVSLQVVCRSPCSQSAAHMHNSKLRLHKLLLLLLLPVVPCSPSACRNLLLPQPADLLPLQDSQVSLIQLLCSASQDTVQRVLCGCVKQTCSAQGVLRTLTAHHITHAALHVLFLSCFCLYSLSFLYDAQQGTLRHVLPI